MKFSRDGALLGVRWGACIAAAPTTDPDGWAASWTLALRRIADGPGGIAFDAGWGWDAEVPLRPWPVLLWRARTPRGNYRTALFWLGFFAGIGWLGNPRQAETCVGTPASEQP